MFELKIALKYLVPRKRSISTALISLMSVLVISLVVWLVLVFLSVTRGIETNWLKKLTTLHAPIRISPTDKYLSSYFYQIDRLSAASNYTPKTIKEKATTSLSDPYSSEIDAEIPAYWPKPERLPNGELLDPVKQAIAQLEGLQQENRQIAFQDYEMAGALLRLTLFRENDPIPSYLSQMCYLLSLTEQNPRLADLLLPPTQADLQRLLKSHPEVSQHIEKGVANTSFSSAPDASPLWAYFVNGVCTLPKGGDISLLLPKNYQESGVHLGDTGTLSYLAHGSFMAQEQRIGIRVAGFYDPGTLSVGNKCILAPQELTQAIHAATQTFSPDGTPTNGIFVWLNNLDQVTEIKNQIAERFERAGIAPYWKISTYNEFEFSKDLMLQFQSDRTLFLLIAGIILIVACCNIISLLVLLVNDKKKEIAILQSMGASFSSIAAIFGACGIVMGLLGCLLGSALAIFTLHHLDSLVALLSALQGHAAFNPAFFGQTLPNQLSYEALLFVLIATPILSLAAGLIPAIKASRIRPSAVLRSE